MSAHNLATQIKSLPKLVPVAKGKLLEIDRKEDKYLYLRFVYAFTHIQPIRQYLWAVC